MHHARATVTLAVLLASLPMTGCVVNDIHTEMQTTNQRLLAVDAQLKSINEDRLTKLASIEQSLQSIDASLTQIDAKLGPIGETLTTVDSNLAKVDEHLASLRRTINNIDSTIPFLKVSGDTDEESDALEAENEPAQAEPTDAAPTAAPSSEPATPQR